MASLLFEGEITFELWKQPLPTSEVVWIIVMQISPYNCDYYIYLVSSKNKSHHEIQICNNID